MKSARKFLLYNFFFLPTFLLLSLTLISFSFKFFILLNYFFFLFRFSNQTWVCSNASDNFTDTESRCESSLCFYEFLVPFSLFLCVMQYRMQFIFAEKTFFHSVYEDSLSFLEYFSHFRAWVFHLFHSHGWACERKSERAFPKCKKKCNFQKLRAASLIDVRENKLSMWEMNIFLKREEKNKNLMPLRN